MTPADDHPVLRMSIEELVGVVEALEATYRTATAPQSAIPITRPRHKVTLADLARIRASLRRSVAHLDRLLAAWDQRYAEEPEGNPEADRS